MCWTLFRSKLHIPDEHSNANFTPLPTDPSIILTSVLLEKCKHAGCGSYFNIFYSQRSFARFLYVCMPLFNQIMFPRIFSLNYAAIVHCLNDRPLTFDRSMKMCKCCNFWQQGDRLIKNVQVECKRKLYWGVLEQTTKGLYTMADQVLWSGFTNYLIPTGCSKQF